MIPPRLKIALIRLSSLGDVVHALPVASALRRLCPGAELTWVVERRERAVLDGNPDLQALIDVDTRLWRREFRRPSDAPAVAFKIRGLVRRLSAGRFDAAIDLQGLWKSGIISWLTRAPLRVGFAAHDCREWGSALFSTARVAVPPDVTHVVDANLSLLAGLGLDPRAAGPPRFPVPRHGAAEAAMSRYLEAEGLKPESALVVMNAGSGGDRKRWPIEAYRRLGDELAVRLEARVLLTWGPGEEPLARAIAHGMRMAPLVPSQTSIQELIALLRRASVVIGADTGPIHLSAALGTPTVGLYGPTSARRNGPYGPRVRAVQSPSSRMEDIGVAEVQQAVEALLR